jgi:integrase
MEGHDCRCDRSAAATGTRRSAGLPNHWAYLPFGHELRHTGATLAAATGATTKELVRRMGHASPAAALIYQHAVDDRDSQIARALDAMLTDSTMTPLRSRPI